MPFFTDGYQTTIMFTIRPFIRLKEREVQPPDLDSGGEIDTSTMRNFRWRSKAPKSLITAGDITLQVNYDPSCYADLVSILGINGIIDIFLPDGSALAVWGWLDKFTPASLKEGDFPMAEVKIHCSNRNNSGKETAATYYEPIQADAVEEAFETSALARFSSGEGVAGAGTGGGSSASPSLAPNMVGD